MYLALSGGLSLFTALGWANHAANARLLVAEAGLLDQEGKVMRLVMASGMRVDADIEGMELVQMLKFRIEVNMVASGQQLRTLWDLTTQR